MERGFSILSIDAICASVQNGITPPMMREYRPMAAPFAERRVAEPPTHVPFGRRIVRSDGNAQKSLTAPEKRAPAECHKRGNTGSSDWNASFRSDPKAAIRYGP